MFPSQGYREKVTENMRGVACFFGQQKGRGRFQLSSGCSEFLLPLRSFSKHSQEYDTDARGTNFSQLPNHPTLEGASFLSSDASRPHSTSALRPPPPLNSHILLQFACSNRKGGIQWAAKQPTHPQILCVFKRASAARSQITMDNRKSIAATHCEWASFFRFSFQARMGHG